MKLMLIMQNGTKREFAPTDSIRSFLNAIQRNEVGTIVAGDLDLKEGRVLWEKQFNACTVMPSDFGKPKVRP